MSPPRLAGAPVLVVGAGIMGTGIAQVAAQAGHPVMLFDAREGAAAQACTRLAASLQALVARGKLGAAAADATLARIRPIADLAAAGAAALVVEAIVEDLAAKRALFSDLEARVAADCILATNTSSISVTAIANGLARPGRLVGMHFFNPVPQMKLVEVVSGLHTEAEVAVATFELAGAWGKTAVHARSTPGFIVNRIARPYYAETLALLQEQAATPAVLDACLRGAGFRMGPCELMDLIGHDTNFAVTQSVYAANFFDKRYLPSGVQRDLVDGGLLGRKTGRGFYRYPAESGAAAAAASPAGSTVREHSAPSASQAVIVHGTGPIADALAAAVDALPAMAGRPAARESGTGASGWTGLAIDGARLVLTDGRCAQEIAFASGGGNADVAVFDRPLQLPQVPKASTPSTALTALTAPAAAPAAPAAALAYAVADAASPHWHQQAGAWLAALGFAPQPVADTPGLVVARTLAMLINEAADAVLQGVCSCEGADDAMKLGVAYPAGPFEWLAAWPAPEVAALIDRLDAQYRGERYRVSPWLRRRSLGAG